MFSSTLHTTTYHLSTLLMIQLSSGCHTNQTMIRNKIEQWLGHGGEAPIPAW